MTRRRTRPLEFEHHNTCKILFQAQPVELRMGGKKFPFVEEQAGWMQMCWVLVNHRALVGEGRMGFE